MRPDFYARLVTAVQSSGARAIVDTSGRALAAALRSEPWMVKVNARELAEIDARSDLWGARAGGRTEWVVTTLGVDGAVARSSAGAWHVAVPSVDVVNPTGAGDVFLAALVARVAEGAPVTEALRFAGAAAAGSVTSVAPELPDEATLTRVLDATEVAEVRA